MKAKIIKDNGVMCLLVYRPTDMLKIYAKDAKYRNPHKSLIRKPLENFTRSNKIAVIITSSYLLRVAEFKGGFTLEITDNEVMEILDRPNTNYQKTKWSTK
jgi:hypothetical protein